MFRNYIQDELNKIKTKNIPLSDAVKYIKHSLVGKGFYFIVNYNSENYNIYILNLKDEDNLYQNELFLVDETIGKLIPIKDDEELIEKLIIKMRLITGKELNKVLGSQKNNKNEFGVLSPIEELFSLKKMSIEINDKYFEAKKFRLLTFDGYEQKLLKNFFDRFINLKNKKEITEKEIIQKQVAEQEIYRIMREFPKKGKCDEDCEVCHLLLRAEEIFPRYRTIIEKFLIKNNGVSYFEEVFKKIIDTNKDIFLNNKQKKEKNINYVSIFESKFKKKIAFLFDEFSVEDNIKLHKFYFYSNLPEENSVNIDVRNNKGILQFSIDTFSNIKQKPLISKNYKNNYTYVDSIDDHIYFSYVIEKLSKELQKDEEELLNKFRNQKQLTSSYYRMSMQKVVKGYNLADFEVISYNKYQFTPKFYLFNQKVLFGIHNKDDPNEFYSVINNYRVLVIKIAEIFNNFRIKGKNSFNFFVELENIKKDKKTIKRIKGGVLYDFIKESFQNDIDIKFKIEELFNLILKYKDLLIIDALKKIIGESKKAENQGTKKLLELIFLIKSIEIYLEILKGDDMYQKNSIENYFSQFVNVREDLKNFLEVCKLNENNSEISIPDTNLTPQHFSYLIGLVIKYLFLQKRTNVKIGDLTPVMNRINSISDVKEELDHLLVAYGYDLHPKHKAVLSVKLILSISDDFEIDRDFFIIGLLENSSLTKSYFQANSNFNNQSNNQEDKKKNKINKKVEENAKKVKPIQEEDTKTGSLFEYAEKQEN